MRIGFDARMVDWSGIGRYSRNLLTALADAAPEAEFVVFCNRANRSQVPRSARFDLVEVDLEVFALNSLRAMSKFVAEAKVDVFHAPHFLVPMTKRCPIVVTIYDLIPLMFPESMPSRRRRWQYLWLNRMALRRADAVIAISDFTKSSLLERFKFPAERVFVTPLAADPRFGPAVVSAGSGASGQPPAIEGDYLLAVANPKPHKNLAGLIEAFALVAADAGKSARLVLVGAGAAEAFAPLVKRLGLEARVVFAGAVDDDELVRLYAGAVAFVMPSFMEGFGLPVLEAMACGTPVICSNQASLPEVAGDAAAFFDPFDAADMARVITRVLVDDEERRKLVALGRDRAKMFTWEKTAKATLEVYERIL